jgi:hypothetical protein
MPISIKPEKRRTSFYLSDSVINVLRSLEERLGLTSLSAGEESSKRRSTSQRYHQKIKHARAHNDGQQE